MHLGQKQQKLSTKIKLQLVLVVHMQSFLIKDGKFTFKKTIVSMNIIDRF